MGATVLRFETSPQREARLYREVMGAFDHYGAERSRPRLEALVRAMRAFAAPRRHRRGARGALPRAE